MLAVESSKFSILTLICHIHYTSADTKLLDSNCRMSHGVGLTGTMILGRIRFLLSTLKLISAASLILVCNLYHCNL